MDPGAQAKGCNCGHRNGAHMPVIGWVMVVVLLEKALYRYQCEVHVRACIQCKRRSQYKSKSICFTLHVLVEMTIYKQRQLATIRQCDSRQHRAAACVPECGDGHVYVCVPSSFDRGEPSVFTMCHEREP